MIVGDPKLIIVIEKDAKVSQYWKGHEYKLLPANYCDASCENYCDLRTKSKRDWRKRLRGVLKGPMAVNLGAADLGNEAVHEENREKLNFFTRKAWFCKDLH